MNICKIPKQLQFPEFRFVLINKGTKIPFEKKWQNTANYSFDDPKLLKHIEENQNYGVLGGYGNLVIIDSDVKEVEDAVTKELPKTLKIRTGRGGSHSYYICKDLEGPIRLKDTHAGDIGDVQGKGKQVIGAGSLHESGNIYKVEVDLPLAEISAEQIKFTLKNFLILKPKAEAPSKKEHEDLELSITDVAPIGSMTQQGTEYFGEHPVHGSTNKMNFWVNPSKNTWHCFRHDTGGGALSLVAVLEGIIDCGEATAGALRGDKFLQTIKVAQEKYGLKLPEKKIIIKNNSIGNPQLELPGSEKLISEFAKENADILKDKNTVFYRTDARQIIEIGKIKTLEEEEKYLGFVPVIPARFITLVEKYYTPGRTSFTKEKGMFFSKRSLTKELSSILLASEILQQELPQIERVFTIPLPIMHENELTFPKKGYDERFLSWLPHDAPEISNPEMSLEEAKEIMKTIFHEFCFETKQDYHTAISALLTPFIRGIFSSFNIRTPVFFYLANRERAGKDYLAGITGLVYEGTVLEEPPINTQEKTGNKNEELRKKILSAMMSGRKRLHFSNNKGYINNAVFEGVITSETYSDRVLGKNEILTFDNEMDFSLSGNTGIGFTPDFGNRCRMIRLFLEIEDANSRRFETPNLHLWVKKNRKTILSALYSLVNNWIAEGSPKGSVPFTSFSQWANICGGIMETAGYLNPCTADLKVLDVGGDLETTDMKRLFEDCFVQKGERWISKTDIKEVAQDNEDIFTRLDLLSRAGSTTLGMKITKFVRRELSGITLVGKHLNRQTKYQEFKFTKSKLERDLFDF